MGNQTTTKVPKQVDYPIYEMEKRGKLILPPEIISQITFLHSHCGTDEWSGLLLYDVISGNPSDPENFKLEAKHIFLMDIGSAAYTDYEPDGDIVDIYDKIPEAMEWKMGHIHTHHSMKAYFSQTDMSELHTNVDKHNYYLSLIVNFSGNFAAKVVFLSDMHTTSKMNYKNDSGVMKHFKQSKVEKHMVTISMSIMFSELGGFFSDRLTAVKKQKEAAEKARAAKYKSSNRAGYQYGGYHGNNSQFRGNRELPPHNQGPIDSKIIPDKMTSWEVERLTKNVLTFDVNLKAEDNVYKLLHQIAKSPESELELFYDYMISHAERVVDAFFDIPLADDEYMIVFKEVIMCIKKYEGLPLLTELVSNIEEALEMVIVGYDDIEFIDQTDLSEKELAERDIAEQLENMEKDLL